MNPTQSKKLSYARIKTCGSITNSNYIINGTEIKIEEKKL